MVMLFHIEERQLWMRTHTHTSVRDCDPDFARFARDPSGRLLRMLRIWLAERRGPQAHLQAYLGTLACCPTGPSFRELRRLLRLASRAASAAGHSAHAARRHLAEALRRYVREPAVGPSTIERRQ